MESGVCSAIIDLPLCGLNKCFVRSVERGYFLNGSDIFKDGTCVPVVDYNFRLDENVSPGDLREASENAYLSLLHKLSSERASHVATWANIEIYKGNEYSSIFSFDLALSGLSCVTRVDGFGSESLDKELNEWFLKYSK